MNVLEPESDLTPAVVREGFDAFNRGDLTSVLSWIAPDCQWEENQAGGFPGLDPVYVGAEGFRKWAEDTRAAWIHLESHPEDVAEVATPDGPSFVVATRLAARGRHNLEVDWLLFNVIWTRDGFGVRRRIYFDRDEAFAWAARPSTSLESP
ncbi:MAG: hypothetical protein NVSMB51_06560 [Solirubrobacteraceae bacterium]